MTDTEKLKKRLIELHEVACEDGQAFGEGVAWGGRNIGAGLVALIATAMEACRWAGLAIDVRAESAMFKAVARFFGKQFRLSWNDGFCIGLTVAEDLGNVFVRRAEDMMLFVTPDSGGYMGGPATGPPPDPPF